MRPVPEELENQLFISGFFGRNYYVNYGGLGLFCSKKARSVPVEQEQPPPPCGYPATIFYLLRILINFQIKLTKIRLKLSRGKLKQNQSLKKFKNADRAPVGANKKGLFFGF